MIFVTSYENPDLDGIACAIAYSELLGMLGKAARATYYGELGLEVNFVKNFTNYFPVEKHEGNYPSDAKFILVDTADLKSIEPIIPPKRVIEIYDHRQLVVVDKFINAKKFIEQVGSCATLITEEFQRYEIEPNTNSAIYLYSAIVSNTINFKNSITTLRDARAAEWLNALINLPVDYIKQMFGAKSHITSENLYQLLNQDFAIKVFGDKKVGIAQIEVVDLEEKIFRFNQVIDDAIKKLKRDNQLDYVFFSGIDINEGYNIFHSTDQDSIEVFAKALEIPELKTGYKTSEIIMRKQMWPKLGAVLGKANS